MPVTFTSQEISQKYNRVARWYDWIEGIPDLLGVRRLRRQLLRQASGRILEIAVGTGTNLHYYPEGSQIVAVDVSREMLNVARKRAAKLSIDISFLLADAEALPFADKSFDTTVSSLSTCTFLNPIVALQEMARVCRTTGNILLLEHGRSDREWLARFQDRHADQFARPLGCHWNREPVDLAKAAALNISKTRHSFLGIFHEIQATPQPP